MTWLLSLSVLTGRKSCYKKIKIHKSEKTEPEACCGDAALGQEAADLNYITGKPTWIVRGVCWVRIFLITRRVVKTLQQGPKEIVGPPFSEVAKLLLSTLSDIIALAIWMRCWTSRGQKLYVSTNLILALHALTDAPPLSNFSPFHKRICYDNGAISDNQCLFKKRTNIGRQARFVPG